LGGNSTDPQTSHKSRGRVRERRRKSKRKINVVCQTNKKKQKQGVNNPKSGRFRKIRKRAVGFNFSQGTKKQHFSLKTALDRSQRFNTCRRIGKVSTIKEKEGKKGAGPVKQVEKKKLSCRSHYRDF